MTQESNPDAALEDSDADLVIEEDEGEEDGEQEAKPEGDLGEAPAPGDGVLLPDGTRLGITPGQQARIDLLYDALEKATYYEILQISKDAPARRSSGRTTSCPASSTRTASSAASSAPTSPSSSRSSPRSTRPTVC